MKTERGKEVLERGSFLGLALLSSSILVLSFQRQPEVVNQMLPWFPVILLGYLAVGMALYWFHGRPVRRHEGLRGMGFFYWIIIGVLPVSILAKWVPEALRIALLTNLLLALGLWAVDYIHLWRVAKELNHGVVGKPFTLVEDLDEKPKGTEEFLMQIARYCEKNHISLEFVTRQKPALVRMDGVLYRVELRFYYTRYGMPVYTLEFTTESERIQK